jgi:transketolase
MYLSEIAHQDSRIRVLDGDLADSDGAIHFAEAHPDRFTLAGAAEQCMVSMAAGLASCGLRPWVFSFASFLCYRAYDQIRVCVSQARQPVALVGSHSGGCGGRNGKTHLALNDIGLMASLPGMQVWAPASRSDVQLAVRLILGGDGPAYLRLPRMQLAEIPGDAAICRWLLPPQDVNFVSTGLGTHLALDAAHALEQHGLATGLLHCTRVYPLPRQVREIAAESGHVLAVEDHYSSGGLASLIREVSTSRRRLWSP